MKIPDRLPNPPKYRDFPELTKEEWEDYYACREKYDIAMTDEEKDKIRQDAYSIFESGKKEQALDYLLKLPAEPFIAIVAKIAGGFEAVKYLNLSEAKKFYPDEF